MNKKHLVLAGIISALLAIIIVTNDGPSEFEKDTFDSIKKSEEKVATLFLEMNDIERVEKQLIFEILPETFTKEDEERMANLELKRNEKNKVLENLSINIKEYEKAINDLEKINVSKFLNEETKISGNQYLEVLNERLKILKDVQNIYKKIMKIENVNIRSWSLEETDEKYLNLEVLEKKYNDLLEELIQKRAEYVDDFGYEEKYAN